MPSLERGCALAALWIAAAVGACLTTGANTCVDDGECDLGGLAGVCQPDGWCSYPDDGCASGQRYSQVAGAVAGQCVSEAGTGGSSTSTASTATSDPSLASTSSSTGEVVDDDTSTGCGSPLYYVDADLDGYGDPNLPACGMMPGSVDNGEDCDDTDDRIKPGGLLCPDNPASMLGWFRFEDGQELQDSSQMGLHGMERLGSSIDFGEPGPYGQAARLDDELDGVDINDVVETMAERDASPDAGTLEAWVMVVDEPSLDNEDMVIVHLGDSQASGFGAGQAQVHLHATTVGMQRMWQGWVSTTGGSVTCVTPTLFATIATTEWTHLAFTWEQTVGVLSCELYVDGQLASMTSFVNTTVYGEYSSGTLGRPPTIIAGNGPTFVGWMDEVMIFDAVRTIDEVQADCGSSCSPR